MIGYGNLPDITEVDTTSYTGWYVPNADATKAPAYYEIVSMFGEPEWVRQDKKIHVASDPVVTEDGVFQLSELINQAANATTDVAWQQSDW